MNKQVLIGFNGWHAKEAGRRKEGYMGIEVLDNV